MSTITCPLIQAARHHGNNPAIVWGHRRITYAQLNQFVNTTVKALKERNLKTGSRVGMVVDGSVEAVIVLLSLWRLGAVACPINPRFPEAPIAELLKKLQGSAVVTDKPNAFAGLRLGIPKIFITDLIVFDVKDSFFKNDFPPIDIDPQQEAAVILTSGSSGEAKAAVLTYGNLYLNALGSNEMIPLLAGDRWALSLPLFHVSGLGVVMRCLIAAAAIAIVPQDGLADELAKGKITHVSLVPAQLHRLLRHPSNPLAAVKAVLLGGSAVAPVLIDETLRRGLPVFVSYGLTEMASQVATAKVGQGAVCLAHREIKISSDGEICVRGAALFKGYLKDGTIDRPLDAEGWFHTGDVGTLDERGALHVAGRRDNMFISGGENIHPEEIERVLLAVEGIAQAVVVPRDDENFGRRPVAFLQWHEGTSPKSVEALRESLARQLPKFKIPVEFLAWPDGQKGIKPDRKTLAVSAANKRA